MSSPNAATRTLAQVFRDNLTRSDISESSTIAILSLLDQGALVADSARPVATVVAAIKSLLPDGAAKTAALQHLESARRAEAQG